jgi:hypothetical protein
MEAEFQGAMISWMQAWADWCKAWAKMHQKRGKRR